MATDAIWAELARALPPGTVLTGEPARRHGGAQALAWIRPGSADDVAAVLVTASAAGVAVVPRGGNTLGAGAHRPHLALDLTSLPAGVSVDAENHTAQVGAAATTHRLQAAAAAARLYYPPDPISGGRCTIGGNVATNAGGPSTQRYGATGQYLLGLEVVTPGGRRFVAGGSTLKNATGYDLPRLFCGTRGVLGIVTAATVRLLPAPPARSVRCWRHLDLAGAATRAQELAALPTLTRAEVLGPAACRAAGLPGEDAWVWAEFEGHGEEIARDLGEVAGGETVGSAECRRFWAARARLGRLLGTPGWAAVRAEGEAGQAPAIAAVLRAALGPGAVVFGHGAGGVWHGCRAGGLSPAAEQELAQGLARCGAAVGGAGCAPLLGQAHGPALDLIVRLKRELDPAEVLNPDLLAAS